METRILRWALASPLHQICSTHTSLWPLNFYYTHSENVLTGQKASTKSLYIYIHIQSLYITIAIINTISSSWASSSLPVCRFFLFGLPKIQRRVLGYMQRGRTISRLVLRVRTLRLRKSQECGNLLKHRKCADLQCLRELTDPGRCPVVNRQETTDYVGTKDSDDDHLMTTVMM